MMAPESAVTSRPAVDGPVALGPAAGELVADTLGLVESGVDLVSAPVVQDPARLGGSWLTESHRCLARTGFVLLEGFPVTALRDHAALAFWRLSSLLGEPMPQNLDGQRVDVVRNEGAATVRGAKTDRELIFHTDFANGSPDVFGLLTVRQARTGGDSLLVDGRAVVDALREQRPEVLDVLGEPFLFDRTGDVAPDRDQVVALPVLRTSGELRVVYNRARIHRGHRIAGRALTAAQSAALDTLDEYLASPRLRVRLRLESGQAIFIDNRRILHSRTAFTDWPEPGRGRELLRVWLASRARH